MSGALRQVMAEVMFGDDAKLRARFERACREPDPAVLAPWTAAFGWTPPAELVEWESVNPAYREISGAISDVWMLQSPIAVKLPPVAKLLGDHDAIRVLLTGLASFGSDPSGDSAWVSTLSGGGPAAVYVCDHETGELDGPTYDSIASFVRRAWGDKKAPKAPALAAHADPQQLYGRMKWLWSLPTGEPGFRLAEQLGGGATFATWEAEKPLLAAQPVLANYWLLAHYFLGNTAACAEAVALAKRAPGTVTHQLADAIAAVLADPKAALGKVKAATLAELRAQVARNAEPEQLEPAVRAARPQQATTGVRAEVAELERRLAAGDDPWGVIAEFPDDIAAHKLALAVLATTQGELVAAFEEARDSTDAYDAWPQPWEVEDGRFDVRLAPAVAAAFRAGLAFDADHKRAAPSLANTLAYLDDDLAMDAFAAAIDACKMDDDRLEYVVAALRASKHPRGPEVLARAAWRFFDVFDQVRAAMEKQAARGPTLDDIFGNSNHLLVALTARMHAHDEAAELLADKVLSITSNMRVLGAAYAAAFDVVRTRKLARHLPFVRSFVELVLDLRGDNLAGDAKYNLTEAALALAQLDPAAALSLLRRPLTEEDAPAMRLDKLGSVLAGLLVLAPDDPEVRGWADRLLANRGGEERVYGVLRGVAEGKVRVDRDVLWWHAYAGCSSNHLGEKPGILRAARTALVALGEPPPAEFDETDEFARRRPAGELVQALRDYHRHHVKHVLKRIVEQKQRSPEIVRVVGALLRDLCRHRADAAEHVSDDDRNHALACLVFQGPPALAELWTVFGVPGARSADRSAAVAAMSQITRAPARFVQLAAASPDEVLAALVPGPATAGTLDVAAGWAFATLGERAYPALDAAIRWRCALVSPGKDFGLDGERVALGLLPLATRLPGGPALFDEFAAVENYHLGALAKLAQRGVAPRTSMDGAASCTLIQRLREHGVGASTWTLALDGTRVTIALATENMRLAEVVDGGRYAQQATLEAASPDDARATADRIVQALSAIGCELVAPPTPKQPKAKPAEPAREAKPVKQAKQKR
jgi:hypothetical protein